MKPTTEKEFKKRIEEIEYSFSMALAEKGKLQTRLLKAQDKSQGKYDVVEMWMSGIAGFAWGSFLPFLLYVFL